MKKINDIVLFGAIALTGTFALSSCSSTDDETAEVNPTYDGETVKTQFAINIGDLGGSSTRMTAENTQSGSNATFKGMSKMHLFALTDDNAPTSSSTISKTVFNGESDYDIANKSAFTNSENYKLYYNVEIPTGTKQFLFYSMGQQATDKKMEYGTLEATYTSSSTTSTPADFKFSLEAITATQTTQPSLSDILAPIVNTKIAGGSTGSETVSWSMVSKSSQLKNILDDFTGTSTSKTSGTVFNGSGTAILATVQLLVEKLNAITTLTDKCYEKDQTSVTTGDMAKAILKEIAGLSTYFTATVDATSGQIKTAISLTSGCALSGYPAPLPDGAVPYQWTAPSSGSTDYSVAYLTENQTIGSSSANYVGASTICYPPSLAYSCNTPVKATTNGDVTWPNTADDWQKETWTGWDDVVTASSTTVAMKNNINYGTAKLDFTVQAQYPENTSYLEDNSKASDGKTSTPLKITLSETKNLKLTGILIGGQKQDADWQFLPKANVASTYTNKDVTVYSNLTSENLTITGTANPTTKSYCLALDNFVENDSATVNVALEFENNTGYDFQGVDGLVAKGQKFYLVGKLDPKLTTNKTELPNSLDGKTLADLRYPTIGKAGFWHVFMQDFETTANFKFNSLKNAYVNIPDLRTTQLVLGLSVNMVWQTGLTFTTTIGE